MLLRLQAYTLLIIINPPPSLPSSLSDQTFTAGRRLLGPSAAPADRCGCPPCRYAPALPTHSKSATKVHHKVWSPFFHPLPPPLLPRASTFLLLLLLGSFILGLLFVCRMLNVKSSKTKTCLDHAMRHSGVSTHGYSTFQGPTKAAPRACGGKGKKKRKYTVRWARMWSPCLRPSGCVHE